MNNKKRGMTLVELMGVMVVLTILATVSGSGILKGQEKARVSSALSAIDAYESAFTVAATTHPSIVSSRAKAWADEVTYTSKDGLGRVAYYMNEILEDQLVLQWDDMLHCYRSAGVDPWGGYYILTEYPISADGATSYWDPTVEPGASTFACAIFSTGKDDLLLGDTHTVSDDIHGVGLVLTSGLVTSNLHNFNDQLSFDGWTVKFQ